MKTTNGLRQSHDEARFNNAVIKVRQYFAIGREALRRTKNYDGKYARGICRSLAEAYGVSRSLVDQARMAARAYDEDQLQRVLDQFRMADMLPTIEVFPTFATVPDAERGSMEARYFAERMSIRALKQAMRDVYGKRNNGGKKRKVPQTPQDAAYQIHEATACLQQLLIPAMDQTNVLALTLGENAVEQLCQITEALRALYDGLISQQA